MKPIRRNLPPGEEPRKRPWILILLIGLCLFLIEHELSASLKFQEMLQAESIEDLDAASSMFQTTAVRQVGGLFLGIAGAAWLLFMVRRPSITRNTLAGLLILFAAWNFLSFTWSIDMGTSLRRLVLFGMLILGAVAAAKRFTLDDILLLALLFPGVFLAIGVGAEIMNGTFAPWRPGFRFCGTLHPNEQAINCVMLLLAALSCMRGSRHWKFFALIALVAFTFLIMTKSRTALASTLVAIVGHYGLSWSGYKKLAVASLAIAGISLFFLLSEVLLPYFMKGINLGRMDAAESVGSLTGRVPLWTQVLGFYSERPFLGYGYGAFWSIENTKTVMFEQGWPISHSHNAYIDVLLETGPIGVLLFALVLLVGIRYAYVYHRRTGESAYAFFGVLLLFSALNATLESVSIHRTQFEFMLILALSYMAMRGLPQRSDAQQPLPQARAAFTPQPVAFRQGPEATP
jgi:O-antigen ligase